MLSSLEGIMIESPFRFENHLTPEDFQRLGKLMLRWSHTEHIVAHCLRLLLHLSEDEANIIVFPLRLEQRLQRISKLIKLNPLPPAVEGVYREMNEAIRTLQPVRNLVAHVILLPDPTGKHALHLRSHGRTYTKEEIFECEELTNYAACAALRLRFELGDEDPHGEPDPLPERPPIPTFLLART
jgi:hypothetical protein